MATKHDLLKKIKEKRELSGLADSLIAESIESYLAKKKIKINDLRQSEIKIIVKDIRTELRRYAGRFKGSLKDRLILLEKDNIAALLETHASTKERAESYPEIKNLIDRLGAKSILDLGCGLNPLALASSDIKYYAVDINEDDLNIVQIFFKKSNFEGEIIVYDLRKLAFENSPFPEVDLCLLFKVFDVIERKGHKLAETIIKKINCKQFIISFSTKTLSGAPMRHPQRGWIERLLARLGYPFKLIKTKNELFYLVDKL